MSYYNSYFMNSQEYLSEYLEWIDTRIKTIYNQKNNKKGAASPLKGLILSNEDIQSLIDNTGNALSQDYNILEDELFIRLEKKTKLSLDNGIDLRIENLYKIFNLNIAEKIFIILSVAAEINPGYEKIFGFFNDNINKVRPSIYLAMDILGLDNYSRNKIRESFYENSIFRRYILSYTFGRDDTTLFSNQIKLDDKIISYILEDDHTDKDIYDAVTIISSKDDININQENDIVKILLNAFDSTGEKKIIISLTGETGVGKKEYFKLLCKQKNRSGLIINLKSILGNADDFKINIRKSIREALLTNSILAFSNYQDLANMEDIKQQSLSEKIFLDELKNYIDNIVVMSNEKVKIKRNNAVDIEIKRPDYKQRVDIWNYYLMKNDIHINNVAELATKFSFTPLQIKESVLSYSTKKQLGFKDNSSKEKLLHDTCTTQKIAIESTEDKINEKMIYECCYEQVSHNLYKRASKVNLSYSWDQLVLPAEQKELLMDACNQIENKYKVYDEWGFNKTVAYGRGVQIVCSGPPGTGKTMSAQVIASKLNLELYKIDLSQIVSKYVGETEKNLNEIFSEAKVSNAILFFDEADSLFGKRSEVKSSNDRYSNLETSYLLQKIEEYEGVSMLATNYLKNIDDAFIRRMKFIINFPFPDAETRKKIWRITIPESAPVSSDIDFDFLAEEFELSGGNIKNILVYAAFLSASANSKINMRYILKATQYEMQKIGKLILGQDLKQYRHLLENN